MIIRQALNFTAHLAAGVAVGALAVTALRALRRRQHEHWTDRVEPEDANDAIEPR